MRRKLLVSAGAVVALSTISVVALANSFSGSEPNKHIQSTPTYVYAAMQTEIYEPETQPMIDTYVSQETQATDIKSLDWDSDDAYLLAKIAMAEAEGEDTEGKALVMLVVLNRVWSDEFPNTISEVIYQEDQFSPVSNGRFESVEPSKDCYKALDLIQLQHWDESEGALYFESASASTWHRDNLKLLFQHGRHMFYTNKEE